MLNQQNSETSLSLTVLVNDAPANGKSVNVLEVQLIDANGEPRVGVRLAFRVLEGNAVFVTNNLGIYAEKTDVEGKVRVELKNLIMETVLVSSFIQGSEIDQVSTRISFTEVYEPFLINSVQTLNHSLFLGEPTVVWVGASFVILTKGGSGLLRTQVLSQQAYIKVTNDVQGSTLVEIMEPFNGECRLVIMDSVTQEQQEYRFTVKNFIEFVAEAIPISNVIHQQERAPLSLGVFNDLFEQWGSVVDYPDWRQDLLEYWTDEYSLIGNTATVFDVRDGKYRSIAFVNDAGHSVKKGFVYTTLIVGE